MRIVWLALAVVACGSKEPAKAPPTGSAAPPAVKPSAPLWSTLPDLSGSIDVSISAFESDGPPEAQWSWVSAAICGEDNPFLFATSLRDAHVREGLRCGRTLVEHAPAPATTFAIDLNRAAHEYPLRLFVLPTTYTSLADVEPLLVGFHRESNTLCRAFQPGATCGRVPEDKAIAIVDGYIVSGSAVALAELLGWSERARVLALLPAIAAAGVVEVDLQPPGEQWTIGPMRWLPYSRVEAESFADVVRKNARAVVHDVAWGLGTGSITPIGARSPSPQRPLL